MGEKLPKSTTGGLFANGFPKLQSPSAPSSLATLPTEKINLQKSGSSAGKSANKVETKKTSPQRRTSWMGGSSDVNRINDNFFDSNTQIEPVKPKSSSATIDILQSVKSGGSLKPTTYRGMK